MNKFLTLTEAQRRTVFEQTAAKIKLPVVVIEKDFWVTEILNILFSLPYADKMVFKGGTSLSKVWGIIRRFSEDIDIAIDCNMFGIEGDVTKKQLKKLRKESSVFVRDTLANDLTLAVKQAGLSLLFESALGINSEMLINMQTRHSLAKSRLEPSMASRISKIRQACASWLL